MSIENVNRNLDILDASRMMNLAVYDSKNRKFSNNQVDFKLTSEVEISYWGKESVTINISKYIIYY